MKLREWQEKLSEKVIQALRQNFLVALQAPTGSGKTIFALHVGFKVKERLIFVVRTHNQFFPVYRELKTHYSDKDLAFIIGKSSACLYTSEDVDPQDIYCNVCPAYKGSTYRLIIKDPPSIFLNKLKEEGKNANFCPYYSLLDSVNDAHVVIMTYPYLFFPWLRDILNLDFSKYVIIIDEAHNIDNISNIDEKRLSRRSIDQAINQARSNEARRILEKLKNTFNKLIHPDEKNILVNDITELKLSDDEIRILEDEYNDIRQEMIKSGKISKNFIGNILRFLYSIQDERIRVFSYSDSLVAKYIISSDFINILNDEKLTFMLMSGTMPPLDYLKNIIGINRREIIYIDVEKAIKNKVSGSYECFIALDVTSAYALRSEEMAKKYASYLLKIFYNSSSHVMAIFPSYEFMNKVSRHLSNINYIKETPDTSIEEVMISIKDSKSLIMGIARGKLSEGVELVSNGRSLISDIIVAGVPFPPVDDYLKIRADAISKALKKDISDELIRIQALISVKQSIGRAIRSPNDKATVWLLDKRFNSLWWKRELNCLNARKIKL